MKSKTFKAIAETILVTVMVALSGWSISNAESVAFKISISTLTVFWIAIVVTGWANDYPFRSKGEQILRDSWIDPKATYRVVENTSFHSFRLGTLVTWKEDEQVGCLFTNGQTDYALGEEEVKKLSSIKRKA